MSQIHQFLYFIIDKIIFIFQSDIILIHVFDINMIEGRVYRYK